MKKILVSICTLLIFGKNTFAETNVDIKKYDWNGVDLIFLEDNRFPTFNMLVYFADGALSDQPIKGETIHAFNYLTSGTDKYSEAEILDAYEFMGANFNSSVTHEYSTISLSGLMKDFSEALKLTCHLLNSANFPADKIKVELEKEKSDLKSMIAEPQSLTERVFREYSMRNTPYGYPVPGKLADLDKIESSNLRNKMNYFLKNVKKRIYVTAPKEFLSQKDFFINQCQFSGKGAQFVRTVPALKKENMNRKTPRVVFAPIEKGNQAQLRVGRFLDRSEIQEKNLDTLASDFLGGGFTSKLMREIRVKRGLTYSVGSFISSQKEYGRAGISTFTKNETINRLIEVIYSTLDNVKNKGVKTSELELSRGGLIGSHPFKFESSDALLGQLIYLDHVEKPYTELFNFHRDILKFSNKDVQKKLNKVFHSNDIIYFVLGDKSLQAELSKLEKKFGPIEVLNTESYL